MTNQMQNNSLAGRILAVQNEVGAMSKDKKNPFFNSAYFDINQLIHHLQPVLAKHGVTVIQPLSITPSGQPALKTVAFDGVDKIEEITPLPDAGDPQKMGAAITYYRRYALASFFLIQSEDDDANSAKKPAQAKRAASPSPSEPSGTDDFGL